MKYIAALSVVTTFDLPLSRRTAIVQELTTRRTENTNKIFHFGNH